MYKVYDEAYTKYTLYIHRSLWGDVLKYPVKQVQAFAERYFLKWSTQILAISNYRIILNVL